MQSAATDRRDELSRLDERQLVRRAREGDERVVRTLVRRHNQRLFRIARGIVRNDAEAEDIVQETYVRAFAGLQDFREEASLATWLARIAHNEALGRLRRQRATVDLSELERDPNGSEGSLTMFPSSPASSNPESDTNRSEVRRVLEQAVDDLPEPFRLVFILRDVEGLSTEEAAEHLSIRVETVKTRLHRARRQLRLAVEKRLTARFSELYPFDGARCAGMANRVVEKLRVTRL